MRLTYDEALFCAYLQPGSDRGSWALQFAGALVQVTAPARCSSYVRQNATTVYQSPWTTAPLWSVTTVALPIQSSAAAKSAQVLVACQWAVIPAGDS